MTNTHPPSKPKEKMVKSWPKLAVGLVLLTGGAALKHHAGLQASLESALALGGHTGTIAFLGAALGVAMMCSSTVRIQDLEEA